MIYGYCRISTPKQSIERQVRNILAVYPSAKIVKETYTGTKFQGRKALEKILKRVKANDTIVFDSVSRMSRTADEGFKLYQELFEKNINLVFLKEHYIDTDTYRETLNNQLSMTGTEVDVILEGINKYLLLLAKKQIEIAFEQAEKEVQDLHVRISEGIRTTQRLNETLPEGERKQIGQKKGATFETQKAKVMKERILRMAKDFDGSMKDKEVIEILGISRNTYYKYKKELLLRNIR